VSLAHRATGVLLFLSIPLAVYLLDLSVSSAEGFQYVRQTLNQPFMLVVQIILLWSFAHHFFAGIRFLLIDADIGVEKVPSRVGAWLVVIAEVVTLLIIVCAVGL